MIGASQSTRQMKSQHGGGTDMNETIKNLCERRSIRSFSDRQLSSAHLEEILEAGKFAPSGMNRQSAVMVVVQKEETLSLLRRLNSDAKPAATSHDPFYNAPTVIVVLADGRVHTCVEDGCLVMGNLMNAAHSLGVGSCWIHRARETFETAEGKALLEKWGLDENYIGIGNCILGYTEGEYPSARARKDNYVITD